MNTTTLYLIRHGETDANKQQLLVGSTDISLNDHGRWQAATLRERINA
jgi:broad specificity phosphatase PhoE